MQGPIRTLPLRECFKELTGHEFVAALSVAFCESFSVALNQGGSSLLPTASRRTWRRARSAPDSKPPFDTGKVSKHNSPSDQIGKIFLVARCHAGGEGLVTLWCRRQAPRCCARGIDSPLRELRYIPLVHTELLLGFLLTNPLWERIGCLGSFEEQSLGPRLRLRSHVDLHFPLYSTLVSHVASSVDDIY